MKSFILKFKSGSSITIYGNTFRQAVLNSGMSPFLVADVESVTEVTSNA